MLAPNVDPLRYPNYFKELRTPLLCSPKLDGIRCIVKNDIEHEISLDLNVKSTETKRSVCKSRKFIDLPNKQVQKLFSNYLDLDGEVIEGEETDFDVYNRTQSYVMSENKTSEDPRFRVFDFAEEGSAHIPFEDRFAIASAYVLQLNDPKVTMVEHILCKDVAEVLIYEEMQLKLGYEGIMMRDPLGRYKGADGKANRGTWNEGLIYKLKRFEDFESPIIGFQEANTNINEKVRDNLGNAKRSTALSGMVKSGTLGKLGIIYKGEEEWVSCGVMSHKERQLVWDNQEMYRGRLAKIRHFPHGQKDKLRMGRFVGWRDPMDM